MTTWKVRRFVRIFYDEYDLDRLLSRLAVSMNADADGELEVDDSLLNVGLFMHPIQQAADILA
jgi:sulfur relay (sulfurtransferase) DsrC/TusE family protein